MNGLKGHVDLANHSTDILIVTTSSSSCNVVFCLEKITTVWNERYCFFQNSIGMTSLFQFFK